MSILSLTTVDIISLDYHTDTKDKEKTNRQPLYKVILSHGKIGSITPTSRSIPSANKARTTQPTHIEMTDAFLLCLRMASAISTSTSSLLTGVLVTLPPIIGFVVSKPF